MARKRTVAAKETAPVPNELQAVLADIKKHKGENVVLPARMIPLSNHISTGSFILDFALLGGIPDGYATMIYGSESSGKTTITKRIVGNFQKKYPDKTAVWVDFEGLFDPEWARVQGMDLERCLVVRPDTGPEGVDILTAMMDAQEVGMVVGDSIPGVVPKAILDRSAEDQTMAELPRLMGIMCSKILASWGKERKRNHRVSVILLNQWRSKVGFVLGDPRTLPGGRQINHLPTTKIELKNKETMGKDRFDHGVSEHNDHSFKLAKTKHGSSIKEGEFRMIMNPDNKQGLPVGFFDDGATLATYAKSMGFITGGGSSWKVDGVDKKFSRLDEITAFLYAQPERYLALKQSVVATQRQAKGLPAIPPDGYLFEWCEVAA